MEVAEQKATKPSFWSKFLNFLAYGEFFVVLVVIVGIVILVSILFK